MGKCLCKLLSISWLPWKLNASVLVLTAVCGVSTAWHCGALPGFCVPRPVLLPSRAGATSATRLLRFTAWAHCEGAWALPSRGCLGCIRRRRPAWPSVGVPGQRAGSTGRAGGLEGLHWGLATSSLDCLLCLVAGQGWELPLLQAGTTFLLQLWLCFCSAGTDPSPGRQNHTPLGLGVTGGELGEREEASPGLLYFRLGQLCLPILEGPVAHRSPSQHPCLFNGGQALPPLQAAPGSRGGCQVALPLPWAFGEQRGGSKPGNGLPLAAG